MTDNLTTLLNKCEALIDCGFVTASQVGKGIGEPRQRISEWITAPKRTEPRATVYLKLHNWCVQQTKKMCVAPTPMQAGYRAAYKNICARRPGNGEELRYGEQTEIQC